MKTERLAQENLKRDMDMRTVRGIVYKSLDETELAKQEHNKIDVLKLRLLDTKSQKNAKKYFVILQKPLQLLMQRIDMKC